MPNISANDDYTTPTGVQLNSAGTYYWVASFSGDANNESFTSGCNDEPVVVNGADIHIVKTADDTSGERGRSDRVHADGLELRCGRCLWRQRRAMCCRRISGLDWTIKSQGSGWGNGASQCAIVSGTLSCGPVTVPAGTTPDDSTFTVHIISTTTAETGVASCDEGTGNVNNTGHVTTSNDGSDDSSAYVCVLAPAIHIVKTADDDGGDGGRRRSGSR